MAIFNEKSSKLAATQADLNTATRIQLDALPTTAPEFEDFPGIFIAMMIVGLGTMFAGLSVLAARMKKRGAIVLFVLSFLCCLGMGYLAILNQG